MKSVLFASAILSSVLCVNALAGDPNDPLSSPDLQCNTGDVSDFCGPNSASTYPSGDPSCFKRVATKGCNIITGGFGCGWNSMYRQLSTSSVETLCKHQKDYCTFHHYTDCDEVYSNCLAYNNTFKASCMA